MEILTSISGDLSRGQTHKLKMGLIFTLKWHLTLKVMVDHFEKKGILTKFFYTYGPNLVILTWTGDEL